MVFLSRFRASASTWSLHRCVVHSGPRARPAGGDCTVARRSGERSTESPRLPAFAGAAGMGVDLEEDLVLDVDMASLLAVGDLSGNAPLRPGLRRCSCVIAQVLLQACRVTAEAHMGIATHSPRDLPRQNGAHGAHPRSCRVGQDRHEGSLHGVRSRPGLAEALDHAVGHLRPPRNTVARRTG